MATREEIWPFYGLRLVTPRLELRCGTEDEVIALGNAAAEHGIHDPATMPFSVPWSRAESPQLQRHCLQWMWSQRAALQPSDWRLNFLVFFEGRPVGLQDLSAKMFSGRRTVESGSWLIQPAQGKGIGKEMRAAVLHLAFRGLEALRAETTANDDNAGSNGVSLSLGYRNDGTKIDFVEGVRHKVLRYAMELEDWERSAAKAVPVELYGVDACKPLLIAS